MSQGGSRGQLHLAILIAAILVGTVGFFTGIMRQVEPGGYSPLAAADGGPDGAEVREAPTQAELAAGLHGPNHGRFSDTLAKLAADRRGLADEIGRATEAEWDAMLLARAEQRAFDGAPPTVPHAITQQGFPACTACHVDGVVIDGRTAPAMSHELMANCTQCHVASVRTIPDAPGEGGVPHENSFAGVQRSGRGARAWAGAPPEIPHTTHLRERCASCHGVLATGIRTSHACQQNCQQCHTSAADVDQQPTTTPPPLPVAAIP